jgi:hypothetical protein
MSCQVNINAALKKVCLLAGFDDPNKGNTVFNKLPELVVVSAQTIAGVF